MRWPRLQVTLLRACAAERSAAGAVAMLALSNSGLPKRQRAQRRPARTQAHALHWCFFLHAQPTTLAASFLVLGLDRPRAGSPTGFIQARLPGVNCKRS